MHTLRSCSGKGVSIRDCIANHAEVHKVNSYIPCVRCTNFRTSALMRHASSGNHNCAIQGVVMNEEFSIANESVFSENKEEIVYALKVLIG